MLSQKTASGKLRRSHGLLGEGPVSAVLIDAIQAWSRSAAVAPMAARSPSRTSVSGAAFDVMGGFRSFAAGAKMKLEMVKTGRSSVVTVHLVSIKPALNFVSGKAAAMMITQCL